MKSLRIVLLSLGTLIVLASSALVAAQRGSVKSDSFTFPVTPGTPEWRQLNSHDEMVAKTRIPARRLRAMSTDGLISTVLAYPLLGDMLAFNGFQQGFEAVTKNFNGLQELLERPDAGERLLARYRSEDPIRFDAKSKAEMGRRGAELMYTELLLAQSSILKSLTITQREELLSQALQKFDSKESMPDVFGQLGADASVLLLARTLEVGGMLATDTSAVRAMELKSFLDSGVSPTRDIIDDILFQARSRQYN